MTTDLHWFSKLSVSTRSRARQWLRADPEAFAEITAVNKRGRPKARAWSDAPYENMARLLTDNPRMPIRQAARLSLPLLQDKSMQPKAAIESLKRHWEKAGNRFLKAEQQRRLAPPALSASGSSFALPFANSLGSRSYRDVAAELERDGAARLSAEQDYIAILHQTHQFSSVFSPGSDPARAYGQEAYLRALADPMERARILALRKVKRHE
jgi:hypothetical protein